MAEAPARKTPKAHEAQVVRTERITPHMVRLVLAGEGLDAFDASEFTDHYIKVLFAPEGVSYSEPFDMARIREEFPREQWPVTRTYTVRSWDPALREMVVDFVVHGTEGLAGPWAAAARPGDTMRFLGPGGGYAPDPAADWHLLAGDESALPAIAAAVERMPHGRRGARVRGGVGPRRGAEDRGAGRRRGALAAPRHPPGGRGADRRGAGSGLPGR